MPKPKLKNALKTRSSIRWKNHDYSSAGFYFITLCCQKRLRWMGEVKEGKMKLNPIGEIITQEWQATNKKRSNVKLHEYVIMPDHIHGIIEIIFPIHSSKDEVKFSSPKNTIGSIIRGFKSATTVQILEYISKRELHWRRGELTFAQKQSDRASDSDQLKFAIHESPTRRVELTFAPNASHEVSDPVASELTFAPNASHEVSDPGASELTFAPNACDEVCAADTSELTFAPKHSENHPCKLQMKSGPFKFWQRGYHDRVIRDRDELKRIVYYISQNPTKWSQKMNENSLL